MPWLFGQLRQFLQQPGVVRHAVHDQANDPLPVDQVGHAAATVKLADGAVGIVNQGEADSVFRRKGLMGRKVVATDAQHLDVALAEGRKVPLESDQFVASDRGKIGEVEGEHHILPAQVAEPDRPLGRGRAEIGGGMADLKRVGRQPGEGNPGGSEHPSGQSLHDVLLSH